MTIVDELMTPGCPNCALKHLSAALERMVDGINVESTEDDAVMTLMARAYINLVEAAEGYTSHFGYAIGLLVAAEERCVRNGAHDKACRIRTLRTAVMTGRPTAIKDLWVESLGRLSVAHFEEAVRELPALGQLFPTSYPMYGQDGADTITKMIEWIRGEYFGCVSAVEKGDDDMAMAKKPAAKAPEAAKAACKGGKCAGKKSCKK